MHAFVSNTITHGGPSSNLFSNSPFIPTFAPHKSYVVHKQTRRIASTWLLMSSPQAQNGTQPLTSKAVSVVGDAVSRRRTQEYNEKIGAIYLPKIDKVVEEDENLSVRRRKRDMFASWITWLTKRASKTLGANNASAEDIVKQTPVKGKRAAVSRSMKIWTFIFKYVIEEKKLQKLDDQKQVSQKRLVLAKQLKQEILALGPTFIKVGQVLSTRPDVVPKEYIDELSSLQDKVPGFSGSLAKQIIEKEFGAPITQLFKSFNDTPIAAASLGQVHTAVLHNGTSVAVKVQRQGLRELFDVDLKNLGVLARIISKFDNSADGAKKDWLSIHDECSKLMYEEIDYRKEAENADRFRINFQEINWVKVPHVFWELSNDKVITMEYVPGVKVNDEEGLKRIGVDPQLLAERSGESYLNQLLRHGFFHCDPHPGNMAVDNVDGGRLIYYDFGMMAELKPQVKEGLVDFIYGIYGGCARDICNSMEKMGVLGKDVDRVSVEKVGRYFLSGLRANMTEEEKSKEQKQQEITKRLANVGEDLLSVGSDAPFRFPPEFTFVFRAFTTLEGIGKGLWKNYDLTKIARPYIKELMDSRDGSVAVSLMKGMQQRMGLRPVDIYDTVSQPKKIAYIYDTLQNLENGELKLRVRALESERSFKRVHMVNDVMGSAIVTSLFFNTAVILSVVSSYGIIASLSWLWCAVFGVRVLTKMYKLRKFDEKVNRLLTSGV